MLLPVDYIEYKTSEKAQAVITNPNYAIQNICCMDKTESKVIMFSKDAEFRSFEFGNNLLIENFIDEGDGTSMNYLAGDHH